MKVEYHHTVEIVDGWSPSTLRELLGNAHNIVLVAHTNADGDAVGSLTGMYSLLTNVLTQSRNHAITITPLLPDGCPDDLRWLPHTDLILSGSADSDRCRQAIAEADLVVCMDLNNLDRTGPLAPMLKASTAKRILFDHHIGPDRDSFALVVSDPEISSTCELIYWAFFVTYGATAFDTASATSLFTGMCTDTGTFSYTNRQPGLYLAASSLLAYGIDPMDINRQIKNVFSVPRLRFFGHAMSELLTVYPERETALMVIRRSDMERFGVESAELTGLVNEVMKLKEVDCAILIREEGGRVRLSLRSKCHTDVNLMARDLFDGGGHARAAGATSTLSLADTVRRVKKHLGLLCAALLLALGLPTLTSCRDVPVVDVQPAKGDSLRESMINANRYIAGSEETQIDAYLARRGWQAQTLDGGERLMVTCRGNGPAIGYDDTVVLRYSVEAINGTVIYPSLTDTVVAGRLQPFPGLDRALRTLTSGSRARVIVPSMEAYGVVGDGNRVPGRLILVCDMAADVIKPVSNKQ